MPKPRDTQTVDLFDVPVAPAPTGGSLAYHEELCATLSTGIDEAIKRGLIRNRYDLASRMSELTGREITKAQIDAWTAESKTEWRFPFEYAAAFESACDSLCLQELLGRKRGTRILVGEDALLAEMGRIEQTEMQLKKRKAALRDRLSRSSRK